MWCLSDQYAIREEKDGAGLMADLSSGSIYVLNPVALSILTICYQGRAITLNKVVDEICSKYNNADPKLVRSDTQGFLALGEKEGFLIIKSA